MELERQVKAIREAVALSEDKRRVCFRLSGPGALEAVDALSPRELFLRDGQMLHTLLLNDNANPLADLYVCSDGEDFLLLSDGPDAAALSALIKQRIPASAQVAAGEITADHALLSLNGPYAWEL